jgi:hypothetical protein
LISDLVKKISGTEKKKLPLQKILSCFSFAGGLNSKSRSNPGGFNPKLHHPNLVVLSPAPGGAACLHESTREETTDRRTGRPPRRTAAGAEREHGRHGLRLRVQEVSTAATYIACEAMHRPVWGRSLATSSARAPRAPSSSPRTTQRQRVSFPHSISAIRAESFLLLSLLLVAFSDLAAIR